MLQLIKRCPEYTQGYKEYCQELYDNNVVYFRPTNPSNIDDDWFSRTKSWYDRKEKGLVEGQPFGFHYWAVDDGKVLFTINEDNKTSIHVCEKLGGRLQDTIEAYNEAEGKHLLRRYWITL